MFNAYWEGLTFELPPLAEGPSHGWRRWLDTSLAAPDDLCTWADAPAVQDPTYLAQPRTVVALFAQLRLRQPGPSPRPPQRHTQCAWLVPHASRWATMAEVKALSWVVYKDSPYCGECYFLGQ